MSWSVGVKSQWFDLYCFLFLEDWLVPQLDSLMLLRCKHNKHALPKSVSISLTFIYGCGHVNSCTLMREAFNCRPSLGKRTSELHCFGRTVSAIFGHWSAHAEEDASVVMAFFLRTLSTLFIYLLSNPERVNQKPQWGEGRREMDIDVKWQRIYFLLCVLASYVSMHLFASWVF